MVGAGQRQQPDLLEPGRRETVRDHLADAGDAALPHRASDHAGLAEPAAAGAAAEDLDAHPLVHRLGQRHERRLRVRPLVEVHDRVLGDPRRNPVRFGTTAASRPSAQVAHVVEARDVDPAGRGQPQQRVVPAQPVVLPVADDVGDHPDHLLAVAEHRGVDEVGDRLRVERGVSAGDDERMRVVAVGRMQRDAGQVERGQQVGVAELGGEADPEQVECGHRAVRVDGELADAVLPHQRLEIGPHRVRALGQRVGRSLITS